MPPIDTNVHFWAFAVSAMLIGVSKAGFGGGLGILVGPFLTLVLQDKTSVAWMLPLLLLCDTVSLEPYWKKWDWDNVQALLPGGLLGIILGAFALNRLSNELFVKTLGGLALLFTLLEMLRSYWKPSEVPFRPGFWIGFSVGVFTGFVSTISHVGGLITTVYLMTQKLDSQRFVATTTLFYFFVNFAKVPVYIAIGMLTSESITRNLPFVPMVLFGTALGLFLNRIVPGRWFQNIVRGCVLVLGLMLLMG